MGNLVLSPGVRYDMPAVFGPSIAPDVEEGFDLHGTTIDFETSAEALDALLPKWFRSVPNPTISFAYRHMIGMKWMGGRNYRLVSVRAQTLCEIDGIETQVPFALVIWESDYAPVVAGREMMGAPKLLADIAEVPFVGVDHGFACREYDADLFRARATKLVELPAGEVERRNKAANANPWSTCYWKFIPGTKADKPDADYPVGIRMHTPFTRMWSGGGELEFANPSTTDAPYSSRIVATLTELPRLSDAKSSSFQAKNCKLFRNLTRRLDMPNSAN